MAYYQTKNPDLGKFQRVLQWKIFVGRYITWPFDLLYGYLVYFVAIWYMLWLFDIFFRFGMLCEEKSGNPADHENCLT
jgi:hypothetical protein